jgi:hypothetical protein
VATRYGSIKPARLAAGSEGSFQVVLEQAPMESFQIELSLVDKAGAPQAAPAAPAATASDDTTDTDSPTGGDPE